MKATLDISMYPLNEGYEAEIIDFILRLKAFPGIRVVTSGMSTVATGDYDTLLNIVGREMKNSLERSKAVFVLKLATGERTSENLPAELK